MNSNEMPSALSDIKSLRYNARQKIENGAVIENYKANRPVVLMLLNAALATELVCVLRYKSHYYRADGIHAPAAMEEFLEHAKEEQEHADKLAARIQQLGGKPNLSPDGLLARSHTEYIEVDSLKKMIEEDLVAERIAIESYAEMIRYIGDDDPTTRNLLEEILASEEEHADDLASLLKRME